MPARCGVDVGSYRPLRVVIAVTVAVATVHQVKVGEYDVPSIVRWSANSLTHLEYLCGSAVNVHGHYI